MYGAYRSKDYHEYLRSVREYDKRIQEKYGKSCLTCIHSAEIIQIPKIRCKCALHEITKDDPNVPCLQWQFCKTSRYTEEEFNQLRNH